MHHVYVIENEKGNWYIGYSTNVRQRITDHNRHKNISTLSVYSRRIPHTRDESRNAPLKSIRKSGILFKYALAHS